MSFHDRVNAFRAMSPQERKAYINKQENTQGTLRYRIAQRRSERIRQEKIRRKHETKIIISILLSIFLPFSFILILSALYLN